MERVLTFFIVVSHVVTYGEEKTGFRDVRNVKAGILKFLILIFQTWLYKTIRHCAGREICRLKLKN